MSLSVTPFLWLAGYWKVARLMALAASFPFTALVVVLASETTLADLIVNHQVTATIIAAFTLSAAVGALRNPWDGFYNWFFRFANTMCANNLAEFLKAEK